MEEEAGNSPLIKENLIREISRPGMARKALRINSQELENVLQVQRFREAELTRSLAEVNAAIDKASKSLKEPVNNAVIEPAVEAVWLDAAVHVRCLR